MVIMPTLLTNMFNRTAFESALLVTPATLMIFLLSPLAGLIMQKFPAKYLISLGFIMIAMGYLGLSTISVTLNYLAYILFCFLIGAGYGLLVGPISVLSTAEFEGSLLTASQSVIGVLRQLGTVLAVAVFVSCLNINLATAENNAYHFAENKIKSVDIAKAQKNTILHNIQNKLNHHQNSSDTGIDKASIMQRKNLLTNDSYAKMVREKELNPQTLSKETVYNIRKEISGQVIKVLNHLWQAIQKYKIILKNNTSTHSQSFTYTQHQ